MAKAPSTGQSIFILYSNFSSYEGELHGVFSSQEKALAEIKDPDAQKLALDYAEQGESTFVDWTIDRSLLDDHSVMTPAGTYFLDGTPKPHPNAIQGVCKDDKEYGSGCESCQPTIKQKYNTGDRVLYTPACTTDDSTSGKSWPGTIVADPTGEFPCILHGEMFYMVLFDNSLTKRPLPEGESTLELEPSEDEVTK